MLFALFTNLSEFLWMNSRNWLLVFSSNTTISLCLILSISALICAISLSIPFSSIFVRDLLNDLEKFSKNMLRREVGSENRRVELRRIRV